MADSNIEWTDKVWNVTRGCRRVSPGCGGANGEGGCYAERMAYRFSGPGQAYDGLVKLTANGPRWTGKGRFAGDKLADPMSWRKPQRVFVDSMSDLFFEEFTNEQIAAVFGVMAACPQHTFQVLTKRARRMREWFAWLDDSIEESASEWSGRDCGVSVHDARAQDRQTELAERAATELSDGSEEDHGRWTTRLNDAHQDAWARPGSDGGTEWLMPWPLPNVWIGVSVENQDAAYERLPELLATPAAVRFISAEPLLGPVDLTNVRVADGLVGIDALRGLGAQHVTPRPSLAGKIGWLVAGCESGPGARPCDVAWLRSLRDQCAAAGVPFFLKQAREQRTLPTDLQPASLIDGPDRPFSVGAITAGPGSHRKPGGVIGAPYLDGVQHLAFPEPR